MAEMQTPTSSGTTKDDVLNYVMKSPYNTNRMVLSSLLDSFGQSDNKEEIELTATENKVYTPEEGKVYKKVTVNVPASNDLELVEVTITTENPAFNQIYMPHYTSNGDFASTIYVTGAGTQTVSVPIDKTKGLVGVMCDISLSTPVTVTGGITYTAGEFNVTGTGTITF